MAIKTRQTTGTGVTNKNAPLTNEELDTNFIELVAEDATKADLSGAAFTGQVTISTSTENALDILADSANQTLLRLSHPTAPADAGGYFAFNSDGTTDNNVVTFGVEYSSTDYDVLNIQRSTQNVGIGTVNPGAKLEVSDTDGEIRITGTRGTDTTHRIHTGGTNSQALNITSGSTSGNAIYQNSTSHIFRNQTGATEYARISSDGNVGIGDASPSQTLAVQQSANGEVARFTTTAGGSGSVQGNVSVGLAHFANQTHPPVLLESEEISNADYRSDFHIKTRGANSDSAPTTRVTVTSDGNTEFTGKGLFSGNTDEKIVLSGVTNPYIRWQEGTTNKAYVQWNGAGYLYIANSEDGSALRIKDDLDFSLDGSTFYSIWHEGNDGSGSGLDADTLDGIHESGFMLVTGMRNNTNTHANLRVIQNTNTSSSNDGMYIGYNNSNSGATRLFGGGSTSASITIGSSGVDFSKDTTDVLNFTANSTNDSRGISFNSRTALSADYNDGYLRLNQNSEFTNGVYTPGSFRASDNITAGDRVIAGGTSPTGAGQISLTGNSGISTSPYMSFHEGSTRRAYIQYLIGSNELFIYNEEAGTVRFRGNANTALFKFETTGATNTGQLYVDADDFAMKHSNNDSIVYGRKDANTWLYYDGQWRLRTNTQGIDVRSETSTYSQIAMTTGASADVRGYVYANTSNQVGFLDSDGQWAVRVRRDTDVGFFVNNVEKFAVGSSSTTSANDITVNSDERIKDNVELIPNALEKVQAIRGVTFNRTDTDDDTRHAGVIAQEVEKVLPEVVAENEETGIKSVAYANMVGLLIEAIKEQQTQIDDLKAEVTRLKGFE